MRTTLLALAVSACGVASFALPVSASVIYDSLQTCSDAHGVLGVTKSNGATDAIRNSTWSFTPTSTGSVSDISMKIQKGFTGSATDQGHYLRLTQGSNVEESNTYNTAILVEDTITTTTFHFPDAFNFVSGTVITVEWLGFEDAFPLADPPFGTGIDLDARSHSPRGSAFGLFTLREQTDNDPEYESTFDSNEEPCEKWEGTLDVASSTYDGSLDSVIPTFAWGFDTGLNTTSVTRDALNRRLGYATSTFPMCIVYNWSLILDSVIGPTTGSPNPQTLKMTAHTGADQTLTIDLRNGVGTSDSRFLEFTQTIGNFFLSLMWFAFGFYILTDLLLKKNVSDDDV